MIIGLITVYKCDGDGCDAHRTVTVDRDGDMEKFMAEWFVGVHFEYCGGCKNKIQNLAVIENEERTWKSISQRLMLGINLEIAKQKESQNVVH